MKKFIAILFFSAIALMSYSQENMVTIAGGYSFASFDGSDYTEGKTSVTGWRINGLYEFNPGEGKWAHGFSIGYMSLKGSPLSFALATKGAGSPPLWDISWSISMTA